MPGTVSPVRSGPVRTGPDRPGGHDPLRVLAGVPRPDVVALPDDRWIEAVTTMVAHARDRLAHVTAPERVVFVDSLPRDASGKILKRELRERFTSPGDPRSA